MPTTVLLNEKDLLLRVASGDQAAYKKIFEHYWDHIFSIALLFTKSREVAEDLTQDVFAHIWIKKDKLFEVTRFESYLFVVARNLFFDRLRRKVLRFENLENLRSQLQDDPQYLPSHVAELRQMEQLVKTGIDSLPERQRMAWYLSRYKGLKHKEIADQMGISQESVKSHIVRATHALKRYLTSHSLMIFTTSFLMM